MITAKMRITSSLVLLAISFVGLSCAQNASSWRGWDQISNVFVFGDSYTATSFQVNGTQPNEANPFGNPEFPGRTFSNGRNWIDFLTYQYNDSLLFSYNFAKGGASVDSFGKPNPFRPLDLQVQQFFLPNYAQNITRVPWASDNSLFASFFGINDVNLSYKLGRANMTTLHQTIFATYNQQIEDLYQAGARNFLFLNVPTVNRAPLTVNQGNMSATFVQMNQAAIGDFNMRINNMIQRFTQRHSDATAFMLDTFSLFDQVLDDPKSRPETEGYTNTTGFCFAYSARTYDEDSFNQTCGIPQKEFFWLDGLHPTPPIHDAMAVEIAQMLRNNEFVGSNTTTQSTGTSGTTPSADPSPNDNDDESISSRTLPILCAGWSIAYLGAIWLGLDIF